MIMRVLILALFSFVAFGLSPGTLRNKELKYQNRMLKQTLQQLSETSMKGSLKNEMEKSVGVTYEDVGAYSCYSAGKGLRPEDKAPSCQPGHEMKLEDYELPDYGTLFNVWCCLPKTSGELQVGGEICTQADLDRGCEQWRACVCPPSEGKASMKVAMKNLEKSVGVSYEEVSPYGTCYLEQATYSDCLAGHDKHIEDHVLFRVQWCCKPNSSPSTSDNSSGSISWFVGQAGDGKSCDAICGDHSKRCDKEGLQIQTKTELSSVCQQLTGWSGTSKGSKDIRPHTNVQTKACYGYDNWDSNPASCSAVTTDSSYARICACI